MARARNIKPSFFTNEILGTLDPMISLTFAGLWCLADKDGILEDRPLRIKGELFPYRDGLDVNGYLTVLQLHKFIVRYVVDGARYIQVLNFSKHQHPHHTEKSRGLPHPPAEVIENIDLFSEQSLAPLKNGYGTSFIRDTPSDSGFLIPDSLIPERGSNGSSQPPVDNSGPFALEQSLLSLFLKNGIPDADSRVPEVARMNLEPKANIGLWEYAVVEAVKQGKPRIDYVLGIMRKQVSQPSAPPARREPESPTVPGPTARDPALVKLDQDAKVTKPMPAEQRATLDAIREKWKTKPASGGLAHAA